MSCTTASVGADTSDTDPPEPNEPDPNETQVARAPTDLPACPTEQGTNDYCTEDAKLAGSWVPVDTLDVPDTVTILFNAEGPDASRQTSLMIAVQGEQLFIRHVTCGACRRVLGQGFSGWLPHLSEVQLRELQTRLGLGTDTPLRDSAETWTSFCGDEQGKAALTQLASKTEGETGGRGR